MATATAPTIDVGAPRCRLGFDAAPVVDRAQGRSHPCLLVTGLLATERAAWTTFAERRAAREAPA
jgi:hypothetical protein